MREIAQLLNQLRDADVVLQYALFGTFAQMRYTAPVATEDVDVLVRVPEPNRLDVLSDIYAFCKQKGYTAEGEAVRIGTWPLQFIPAFDDLTSEAIDSAESVPIEGISLRVVRVERRTLERLVAHLGVTGIGQHESR